MPWNADKRLTAPDLEISEFGERVDNDSEDDVESDRRDEDEKRHVENRQKTEFQERIVRRMTHDCLPNASAEFQQSIIIGWYRISTPHPKISRRYRA